MNVSLRQATAGDLPFLKDVYRSARAPELALLPWSDAQKDAFCEMQFTAQDRSYREAHPDGEFLVVEYQGVPVGRLYRSVSASSVEVQDITLLPAWRNRGIGTHLMRATMAHASEACLPLRLHVDKSNPARRLYERLGFREIEDAGMHLRLEWRADA